MPTIVTGVDDTLTLESPGVPHPRMATVMGVPTQ